MDEEVREPFRPTRLLAWVAAGLLAAGVVSAGTVSARNSEAADERIVTAAGRGVGGVDVPSAVPELPSTTTTVPQLAPTPTTATAPPTTQAPRTTTTKAPAPTPATTATTAAPAPAPAGTTLTLVNEHPSAVAVTVNGKTFQLAPGQQVGPAAIPRSPSGNDTVEAALVQEPSCGTGDADRYFPTAGSYRMTITAGPGLCQPGMPGPVVKVARA